MAVGPKWTRTREGLAIERPRRRRIELWLIGLEAFLALGAYAGGAFLLTQATEAMPTERLSRTPFVTWTLPGIALILANGVLPTAVAVAALRRAAWAPVGHLLVGAALTGWIVVQVLMIGYQSWMQPAYLALGLLILALALLNARATRWPRYSGASGISQRAMQLRQAKAASTSSSGMPGRFSSSRCTAR